MGKPVPLLTSATLERLEREAWSQLTFPQLRLYILQKRVKRVWLVIFYASFPTRIETCPKTFKTLILFVVCVCVCTLEEGMGEQYSFNFPLFLPFLFPAFSSELRSYLLSCFVGLN